MPRDKQSQASNQATMKKKEDNQEQVPPPKRITISTLESCPSWLKDMVINLANELCEKKIKELKEELKEDMEEEIKWSLIAHFGEIEEMTEGMKEEVKRNNNKISAQIEKCQKDIKTSREAQSKSNVEPELIKLKDEIKKLEATLKKQERRMEKVEYENWLKTTEIRKLKAQLDDVEQNGNANDVQVVGLPENDTNEDDIKAIVKLGKQKFGVDIKTSDVEHTYRLGKRKEDKPRDIIVKFCKKSIREKFYQNRKAAITQGDAAKTVYVNDHLTEHRRYLLYMARKLYKSNTIKAAWSQGGNVLIRLTENSNPVQIKDHEELAEISDQMTREREEADTN